jgi:phytoene synthase
MALAEGNETNERRFCWEQVLRTNRLFRISQVFAPPELSAQLLPLYALFGAVEEICSEHADSDVARRKLDWWRSEVTQLDQRGSNHPVLRELLNTGAWDALRRDSLGRFFDGAGERLDPASPARIEDLHEQCRRLSEPRFELELSLSGGGPELPYSVSALAVTSGLAQLVREARRQPAAAGYWWLPLSMMAQHGVGRADIAPNAQPPQVQALFRELIDTCRAWSPSVDPRDEPRRMPTPASARHLVVMGRLQAQALGRLRPADPRQFEAELNRVGLTQLYQAWRAARQVNRP